MGISGGRDGGLPPAICGTAKVKGDAGWRGGYRHDDQAASGAGDHCADSVHRRSRRARNQDALRPTAGALRRSVSASDQAAAQRRTFTPFTQTLLQTTTGFGLRTTTAPRGPAQAARTTPSAQTTALAAGGAKAMAAAKTTIAEAIWRHERMMDSRFFRLRIRSSARFCKCAPARRHVSESS